MLRSGEVYKKFPTKPASDLLVPVLLSCVALGLTALPGCFDGASPIKVSAEKLPAEDEPTGPPLTEFELIDSHGEEFRSEQLVGKVWIGSYFFTRCGANCRQLNMELANLQHEYGPRGVQFVSITCDPQFDKPKELAAYAEMINAKEEHWTFLTGDFQYIRRVGHDILDVSIEERAHYAMFTIVDRSGTPRGIYHVLNAVDMGRAKKLLEELLAEPPPDEGR